MSAKVDGGATLALNIDNPDNFHFSITRVGTRLTLFVQNLNNFKNYWRLFDGILCSNVTAFSYTQNPGIRITFLSAWIDGMDPKKSETL